MGIYLQSKSDWPIVGSLFASAVAGKLFSYGGLVFDLIIVPLLIYRRTRSIAYLASVAFHLSNALLFSIHIFPWFMILATTLFFSPEWVKRALASGRSRPLQADGNAKDTLETEMNNSNRYLLYILMTYCLFHLIWPLRCHLYGEEASWTERGHLFSWRMMLRVKEVGIGFAIRDPDTGKIKNVNHTKFLAAEQAEKFGRDPKNILSFAKFLARSNASADGKEPEVYALVAASLNGRKPQLMIDPNVDLAHLPIDQERLGSWIVPLEEPLRLPPWNLPANQWREHLKLPEIHFLKDTQSKE
jgi:hypothetical protein